MGGRFVQGTTLGQEQPRLQVSANRHWRVVKICLGSCPESQDRDRDVEGIWKYFQRRARPAILQTVHGKEFYKKTFKSFLEKRRNSPYFHIRGRQSLHCGAFVHSRNACTAIALTLTRSGTKIYYSSWYEDTMPVNIAASVWPPKMWRWKTNEQCGSASTDED